MGFMLTKFIRCLTIARSHALLSNPKNALALLARASEKCNAAQSHISSAMDTTDSSPPNISFSPPEVSFLKSLLEGEVQHYRALVELSNLNDTAQKNEEGANRQPLVERLNEYPAKGVDLQNLVSYPPKLEPVPVKPLFFDAAWNYIEYPGREVEKVAQNGVKGAEKATSAEQTTQQKKGWFGFGR
jgi:signal recognition particle subunit SRP68